KVSYYESLQPTRPEETVLVDAIIHADWLLRRLRKAEAEIWNREFQRQDDHTERYDYDNEEFPLAAAFTSCQQLFSRLQRRLDAAERSLHCSLAELRRLRNQPNRGAPPTEPEPPHPTPVALPGRLAGLLTPGPQFGFVPSPQPQP